MCGDLSSSDRARLFKPVDSVVRVSTFCNALLLSQEAKGKIKSNFDSPEVKKYVI